MLGAMLLFLIPTLLFVIGFLYETYLSFKRLKNPKNGKSGYVSATWEVTHTLLIFAVVMLMMLFTKSIDGLSSAIFLSTFVAAFALIIRLICYVYIFYVRKKNKTGTVDWIFALSHVIAAIFLVITVVNALWFIYKNSPEVNSQFIPYFIPGLLVVIALCAVPMLTIYSTKK
jgi:cytochrome bd-type quinol oxidase subunit 2